MKSAIFKEPIEKNFESRIVNRFAVDLPFSGMEMIVGYVNHSGDEVRGISYSFQPEKLNLLLYDYDDFETDDCIQFRKM